MSRIHEAMRKAVAEGASGSSRPPGAEMPRKPAEELAASTDEGEPRTGSLIREPLPGGPTFQRTSRMWQDFTERCQHCEWAPDPGTILFYGEEFRTPGSEDFRTLRSRLDLVRERQPLQTLLVTSPMPGEGKTFVAANLAQVMVWQRERYVLLIDGDLRNPRLHLALGVSATPGLSDYLSGKCDEFAVVRTGPLENFFFIPSGTPVSNSIELVANGRLRTLLKRLSAAFDWIIVDSPPVIPVADARLTAEFCDGVLLVLRAESTSAEPAQAAYREFRGKPFVGVLLNQVAPHAGYGYGYYSQPDAAQQNTGRKR